jgi:hypothetical protein
MPRRARIHLDGLPVQIAADFGCRLTASVAAADPQAAAYTWQTVALEIERM